MPLWCRNFLLVSAPRTDEPKRVTFVYPFYSNRRFFERQLAAWAEYSDDLRRFVSAIVVDDGSPTPLELPAAPIALRVFRIEVDIRWNWLAARNIGAHHAADGWLLLTDMDHVVPPATLESIVWGHHDPKVVYAFSRREHTGVQIHAHSASFLMTRAMFWAIGGYDERCSGFYGSDGLYRRRVAETAPIEVLTDELLRYEYVDDSSTTAYKRKQPEDGRLKALVASFHKGSKPKTLSFPYHEVTREAVPA